MRRGVLGRRRGSLLLVTLHHTSLAFDHYQDVTVRHTDTHAFRLALQFHIVSRSPDHLSHST